MTEETPRPITDRSRLRRDDPQRRGVGFEKIGDVAARVLRELEARVVANDNRQARSPCVPAREDD